ncbi:MAG: hypothetical protein H0V81_03790, partial [Solirubrobacterales bacterium]|nr:hypothetical protein [Solirubrobacterales bacterium]
LSAGLRAALRRAERRGEIPAGTADQRVEPLLGMIFAVCLLASAGAHAESRRMLDAARALVSAGC